MNTQKVKIYKDIICLEMQSPESVGWWYTGTNLAYTPIHVSEIRRIKRVILEGNRKRVIVAIIKVKGEERMAAINLVRSDTNALKLRKLWFEDIQQPYQNIIYSPLPNKKTYQPR